MEDPEKTKGLQIEQIESITEICIPPEDSPQGAWFYVITLKGKSDTVSLFPQPNSSEAYLGKTTRSRALYREISFRDNEPFGLAIIEEAIEELEILNEPDVTALLSKFNRKEFTDETPTGEQRKLVIQCDEPEGDIDLLALKNDFRTLISLILKQATGMDVNAETTDQIIALGRSLIAADL